MAKVAHIYGQVREADARTKDGASEAWGTSLTILSEPRGETVQVTVFDRVMPVADAVRLEGREVHAVVGLGARSGRNGGAFLDCNAISVTARDGAESVAVAPVDSAA